VRLPDVCIYLVFALAHLQFAVASSAMKRSRAAAGLEDEDYDDESADGKDSKMEGDDDIEDEGDDEGDGEGDEEEKLEPKVLPQRSTRGKRSVHLPSNACHFILSVLRIAV